MSRGSFGRTVARAAASGGGKNYRARPPILWYLAVFLIVAGGIGLIVYSRNEALHKASASSAAPTKSDNWYTALAFDVCGTVRPNLPANTNLSTAGIRTFGDGIVNTNPGAVGNSSAFTGAHATLGTFVSTYGQGLSVTSAALALPVTTAKPATSTTTTTKPTTTTAASTTTTSAPATTTTTTPTTTTTAASTTTSAATSTTSKSAAAASSTTTTAASTTTTTTAPPPPVQRYVTGTRCKTGPDAGKKAAVVVETWSSPTATGTRFTGEPATIRLRDGEMITVAFVPPGSTIPAPPSKSTLLQDLGKK